MYAALLGVPQQTDSSYYVGFEDEGQHIGLVPGGGPQGMASPVAYWHVRDLEAKLAEVTAAGATVKEPAQDVGGGRLVATVTDPDGNVLGLLRTDECRPPLARSASSRTEHQLTHNEGDNHMADTYTVERKIRIDTPASAVYERIADFHRWPAWSPYEELDPGMDRTYAGAESGVGAVYEWSGNLKAGAGRMEIVDAVDDKRVVIDQRNRKPIRSESSTSFALDDSGDGTAVTWSMTGPVTLMTRIMGIFKPMDRMVGPLFEKGLARLKADAEAA